MSADPLTWTIEITDPSGRDREIKIGVRDGRVFFAAPPGEGGTIKRPRYAAAALNQAAEAAARQAAEPSTEATGE